MTKPRFLLIDDSKEDAMMIERIIRKRNENIQFTWIGDAEVACSHLLSEQVPPYFLILMDIKMPKMTGLEILAELKAQKKLSSFPQLVILSSSSLQRDIDEATSFSNIKFKTKPSGYLEAKTWLNATIEDIFNHKNQY